MGYQPSAPVYTSLFNACALSPFPEDGRMRAHNLLMYMREIDAPVNPVVYNVSPFHIPRVPTAPGKPGKIGPYLENLENLEKQGVWGQKPGKILQNLEKNFALP